MIAITSPLIPMTALVGDGVIVVLRVVIARYIVRFPRNFAASVGEETGAWGAGAQDAAHAKMVGSDAGDGGKHVPDSSNTFLVTVRGWANNNCAAHKHVCNTRQYRFLMKHCQKTFGRCSRGSEKSINQHNHILSIKSILLKLLN